MAVPFDQAVVCPITVGRAQNLEALRRCVEQVQGGKGQTLLIAGEAGIGKSRLVAEARAYAAHLGFLVLQGNCFESDRSLPYAPLLDIMHTPLAAGLPEITSFLPAITLGPAREPEQEKRR